MVAPRQFLGKTILHENRSLFLLRAPLHCRTIASSAIRSSAVGTMVRYMIATSKKYLFVFNDSLEIRNPSLVFAERYKCDKPRKKLLGLEFRCNDSKYFLQGLINRFQKCSVENCRSSDYGRIETVFSTLPKFDDLDTDDFLTTYVDTKIHCPRAFSLDSCYGFPDPFLGPPETAQEFRERRKGYIVHTIRHGGPPASLEPYLYEDYKVIEIRFLILYVNDVPPVHTRNVIQETLIVCLGKKFKIPEEICKHIVSFMHWN